MGQYYKYVNLDKNQCLIPWSFECGAKLMESSYIDVKNNTSNKYISALCWLLERSWKGDHIVLTGDYAEISNQAQPSDDKWYRSLKNLSKIYPNHTLTDVETGEVIYCLYNDSYKEIKPGVLPDLSGYTIPRYIVNDETKEYIDTKSLPSQWGTVAIFPLSLLIACGNGLGGGDYHSAYGQDYVGDWIENSDKVHLTNECPEGEYTEFRPQFTENNRLKRAILCENEDEYSNEDDYEDDYNK